MPSYFPTPVDDKLKKVVYFIKQGIIPSKDQFIEVTVAETENHYEIVKGITVKTEIKYVTDWKEVDPNTIKGRKNIMKDEFLDFMKLPFYSDLFNIEDIALSLGLYTVACPPFYEFDQGGINTLIQSKFYQSEKKNALNRIFGVIPPEFFKLQARNFYQFLETPDIIKSPKSLEVSLSWYNVTSIDPHIPITLNCDVKGFNSFKQSYVDSLYLARSYMIDAIMYMPKITDNYLKRFEDTIYEIRQNAWTEAEQGNFGYNFADTTPRVALAFARLNFRDTVDSLDLKNTVIVYENALKNAKYTRGAAKKFKGNPNKKSFYNRSPEEKTMLSEINQLEESGQGPTVEKLKKITKVPMDKFEKTLNMLKNDGFIYILPGGRIGRIE